MNKNNENMGNTFELEVKNILHKLMQEHLEITGHSRKNKQKSEGEKCLWTRIQDNQVI